MTRDRQLADTAARLGLVCTSRALRRAYAELKSGRTSDALRSIEAGLASAKSAIETIDALVPGACEIREVV